MSSLASNVGSEEPMPIEETEASQAGEPDVVNPLAIVVEEVDMKQGEVAGEAVSTATAQRHHKDKHYYISLCRKEWWHWRTKGEVYWSPSSITVDKGDYVSFGWYPPAPPGAMFHKEHPLEADDKDKLLIDVISAEEDGSPMDPAVAPVYSGQPRLAGTYTFHFKEPGRSVITSTNRDLHLRCEIKCLTDKQWRINRTLKILGAVLALASFIGILALMIVGIPKLFEPIISCDSARQWCQVLQDIREDTVNSSLPVTVFAAIMAVAAPGFILGRALFLERPLLATFGRGFHSKWSTLMTLLLYFLTITVIVITSLSWTYQVRVIRGWDEFLQILDKFVMEMTSSLDAMVILLTEVVNRQDVLDKLSASGIDISTITHSLLDVYSTVSESSKQFLEQGTSLMVSIVRIRLGFLFIGVEISLLCIASALAVMASRRFQRFAAVEALLMVGIVFSSLAVVTSMTSYFLLDHTYDKVLAKPVDETGTATTIVGAALSFCSAEDFNLPYQDVVAPLRSIVNDCSGCKVPQWVVPTTTGEVRDLLGIVYENINNIRSELFVGRYNLSAADSAVLDGLAQVLHITVELIECSSLDGYIRASIVSLKEDIIDPLEALSATDLTLSLLQLVMLVAFVVARYIFDRRRKYWWEVSSGRWFRFRFCYHSHKKLVERKYGGVPPGGQRWQHPPHNELTMHQAMFMWTMAAYVLLLCNAYITASLEMVGGVVAVAQLLTAMAGLTSIAWVGVGKGWHGRMWRSSLVPRAITVASAAATTIILIVTAVTHAATLGDCNKQTEQCPMSTLVYHSEGVYYATVMAVIAFVTTALSELSLGPWFTTAALTLKEIDVAERHLGSTDAIAEALQLHTKGRIMTAIMALVFPSALFAGIWALARDPLVFDNVAFSSLSGGARFRLGRELVTNVDVLPAPVGEPGGCNGLVANCQRTIAQDRYVLPNHYFNMKRQLEHGIRGLLLDIYPFNSTSQSPLQLCHGMCILGALNLKDEMQMVADWLAANPREVLLLVNEYFGETFQALEESMQPLIPYMYVHPDSQNETMRILGYAVRSPWPTLQELIDSNKRVILFEQLDCYTLNNNTFTNCPAWVHNFFQYTAENNYSWQSREMLNCTISNRSSEFELITEDILASNDLTTVQNRLMFVNHFLSIPVPLPLTALQVNKDEVMREMLDNCTAWWSGRVPTMIAVDYWSVGNIAHVVHAYNKDLATAPR
ncbi:hypothetical protein FOL47_000560 [Perkinsus chesapeaki]|uniref:Uncharacterized protein n=1 Tax=Perkinsus chesapeaki TaxID=330153 RepID=A0A7J6N171_PERCH|nr:hypothetical protein FOL47_000560 [Perkinsus chesapeaki]